MTAADLEDALDALADPGRAVSVQRVLGVAPGNYREGDVVLGISMPALRLAAKAARGLPLDHVTILLESPVHEHRVAAAVILVGRYRRAGRDEAAELSRFYLGRRAGIDNWDLVDISAPDLVGGELVDGPRDVLDELAGSIDLWDRRIAVVATHALIKRGELDPTLTPCERLLDDPHHLMHKACGWMLREVGKRDEAALVDRLERHRARMPRTMLRHAIERLEPERRAALMARG